MIQNPTPITTATFNGMWITNLAIFLPTAEKANGFLNANFQPFDGQHLLLNGGKRLVINDIAKKRKEDTTFDTMLTSLITECKRQAGKEIDIKFVTVMAPDTTRPVMAQIAFIDGSFYSIKDCFALAGSDSTFGGIFQASMNGIAREAGLSVE
jgi:hypothetical protein